MSLARKFLTVGTNTMASRILGFVRELLIAASLGAGPVADAFYAAFRFPNLFRRILAEGAFNSAFIPLFSRSLEQEGEAAVRQFASQVLSALFAILLLLTVLVELAAPFFVATIIAPGFAGEADKFEMTVTLSRIMFPYLACMSLVAMLSGILNALHHYIAAAFAPVLLNVILIAGLTAALWLDLPAAQIGLVMGWGVFAAGLAQLALLWIAVRRAGFSLSLQWPRPTDNVRRLLVLAAPAAIAGGIVQFNLFIGQIIASQKAGAIAVLQFADRIYQLPLGVVGIAIGVVLLPELSRALKSDDLQLAGDYQNRSLSFALFLTLPAAAALVIICEPVVRVLFERGQFTAETTQITARALGYFAPGLPAFVLVKVFSPGFFAREDTATPMRIAGITMVINVIFSLILFPTMAEAGIALATTIAGWVNAVLLFALLIRKGHWPVEPAIFRQIGLMALSALLMGAVLYWLSGLLATLQPAAGFGFQVAHLGLLVAAGAGVYFALAQMTGAADLRQVARQISRQ